MGKVYAAGDQLTAADMNPVVNGAGTYAADAVGTDAYAITATPTPTTYAAGDTYKFKAATVNTGPATLNVNGLGAKSILRPDGSALADGDIAANSINIVVYDGTQFLLVSNYANMPKIKIGVTTRAGNAASSTQTIAHGIGRAPRFVEIEVYYHGSGGTTVSQSHGIYDATSSVCIFAVNTTTDASTGNSTNMLEVHGASTDKQVATITVDATNISLAWTLTGTMDSQNMNIKWKAIA